MSDLAALRPTNEAAERKAFLSALKAGESYEPQFSYKNAQRAEEARAKCDKHLSSEFADIALRLLEDVLRDHGSEEAYCAAVWGRPLEGIEVERACHAYAAANGMAGKVAFEWSPAHSVTTCTGGRVKLVTVPGYYREHRLASLLDHEVGTHFVRAFNHKAALTGAARPPRAPARRGWLLATEEGLASLNTHRAYADKRLWVPALHYHAALLASQLPFSGLWRALSAFLGDDPKRLWLTCVRVKRGCRDTGRPGGYYKEQSNFAGALRLLAARHDAGLDFRLLHCVRVSLEDFPGVAAAAKRALASGRVLVPNFLRDEAAYRRGLDAIAQANGVP